MGETTLSRALKTIDEISKYPEGLRFSQIRKFLGNPSPTTVTKILKELTSTDVIAKNSDGAYVLGVKPYFWGKATSRRQGLMQNIREHMKNLHLEFGASVNLFNSSGGNMFCLESFMAPQSPSMWQGGQSLELELPVIGSIFFYPDEKLENEEFLSSEIAKHSEEISLSRVRQMIKESFSTGFQDDFGLFYPGVRRFAVPLKEDGKTIMVLGVGVLEARLKKEGLAESIISKMKDIKIRIEDEINT
jgi:DNA-binding IclR family transcriptional regulator